LHAVHSITTLVGMVVLAAAALLGVAIGVATVELETPVRTAYFLPGALNLLCLGALVVALTTMLSAFDSQRGRTIGLAVGFVVVETIVKIVGRVGDEMDWLRYWTVLTAFEPQIAVNTFGTPDSPMLIYNGFLLGLSALFFIVGAIGFNYRDVPAPL
jgi:ABC-2 type transport system permease protein